MTILLIILLILAIIYLIYQNRKLQTNSKDNSSSFDGNSTSSQVIFDSNWEDPEDLIADLDEARRKRNEAEQEALAFSNLLKLKGQEVSRKDNEITRLKKEKSQKEMTLNTQLKELKAKYSKQGKLLDEEQLENNKLVEKIERLEAKIKELKKDLPGSFPEEDN